MGFCTRSLHLDFYQRLKRGAVGRTCSILILAAPTVDGLCALRILTELLKCDFVPFKVVPVGGVADITAANESFIQGKDEIQSVIMIDCGGGLDLGELLSTSVNMTVYVLDSHRPYHVLNVSGNSQVVILDDGEINDQLAEWTMASEGFKLLEDGVLERRQQQLDSESSEDEEGGGDESDAEEAAPLGVVGNENVREPNLDRYERRRLKAEEEQDECLTVYKRLCHSGRSYGSSIAFLLFHVAEQAKAKCNDYLWCAILGVMTQHLLELVPKRHFEEQIQQLKDLCRDMNGDGAMARDGRIRYEREFQFMLTRHWTLFDSMLHSRYLASRLGVWREKGRRLLETLIVKLGIPLAQCKLDFSSMDMELKEKLPGLISNQIVDFEIEDVSMDSFVREFGFVMRLSASDAVYALTALIEAPYSAADYSTALSATGLAESASPIWVKNFYCAFDALDYQHIDNLKRGIQLAMKQQQVILHEATTILSHRLLRYGKRFRYVVLRHSADLAWLSHHPFSLTKLTLFLADATRTKREGGGGGGSSSRSSRYGGGGRSAAPLVLAAYQAASDKYLVVVSTGIASPAQTADYATSLVELEACEAAAQFVRIFERVKERMKLRMTHDGFDACVAEVEAGRLKEFLHLLRTMPEARRL